MLFSGKHFITIGPSRSHLYRKRHSPTTAQAQRSQAATATATAQCIDQGDKYTRAAGANGMAECNSATIDVDSRPIPIEFFAIGQRLGSKGFIHLDQIKVTNFQTCAF